MNFTSNPSRDIPYPSKDIQLTHLESSIAHGGASNPNHSWRRLTLRAVLLMEALPIQIAHGGAFDINQTKSDLLMEAISISFYSYSHTYHTWSWRYVRCSITGDIQEMSRLSCLLQINSETSCVLACTLFMSYISRLSCLWVDQLRDMCARYLSGMDGLQCLMKSTHEVRGGERE